MAQVELQGVNKSFGNVHVIRDIDLQIDDKAYCWARKLIQRHDIHCQQTGNGLTAL